MNAERKGKAAFQHEIAASIARRGKREGSLIRRLIQPEERLQFLRRRHKRLRADGPAYAAAQLGTLMANGGKDLV